MVENAMRRLAERQHELQAKGGGPFLLTPALSLGERENRSQSSGIATTDSSSTNFQATEAAQRRSHLPEGEGQGEGKRDADSRTPDIGVLRMSAFFS
jgi:hypothetical protein